MFQRITVPLDGSERAERATPVAARIARASDGAILLVRVVDTRATSAAALAPGIDVLQEERDAAAAYLRAIARRPELAGIAVSTAVARDVTAADAILSAATADKSDLIVLCSHGRSGLARWALGSVADKIIQHSMVPVFVLPTGGPAPAHPHGDAERVFCALVPLDGSSLAEAALLPAAQLVTALSAPATGALHLLRVVSPSDFGAAGDGRATPDHDAHDLALDDARSYLRAITQRFHEGELAPLGLQVTWSVREDWDVAATICQVAESGEDVEGTGVFGRCDLICMSTHGHGGLERWLLGTLTQRVLHAARVPLLVVRPQGTAAPEDERSAGKASAESAPLEHP